MRIALAILLSSILSGCAYVSSAIPTSKNATGEAWYSKDKFFLFFYLGTDIYYCPSEDEPCIKAKVE